MGQPAAPMKESIPARRSSSRPTSKPRLHHVRRHGRALFFGVTTVWGFVLGVGFLAGAAVQSGRPLDWNGGISAVLLPGAFLALCSGVAASHLYGLWRARR